MDLESEEEEYDQMAEEFDDDIGRRVKQKQRLVADSSSSAVLKLGGNRRKHNLRKSAIPNRRGFAPAPRIVGPTLGEFKSCMTKLVSDQLEEK